MSTGPDLILGVSRAADTARQQEAQARLERLSRPQSAASATATPAAAEAGAPPQPAPPADDAWSTALRIAGAESAASPPAAVGSSPSAKATAAPVPSATDADTKKHEVYKQFEAVLLQNMIENMLPKDSEAMFGSGTAGEVWKSMLSEKVAAEIARSGAFGIAKEIEKGPHALSVPRSTISKVDKT